MNVLVCGATGAIGGQVAAHLARASEIETLHLAARHEEPLAAQVQSLGGRDAGVHGLLLDLATDEIAGLAEGFDVMVSCAPAPLEEPCVKAAIAAGTPYVSVCDDAGALAEAEAHDRAAERAGVTVVSGCGFSPGLTNMLAAFASLELQELTSLEISVADSAAGSFGATASAHFLAALAPTSVAVLESDGADAPAPIFFPEPVRWVETHRALHPERWRLARTHPNLATEYRIGLRERALADAAVRLGRIGEMGRKPAGPGTRRPSVMHRLARRPEGAAWTAARVEANGIAQGRETSVVIGAVDHFGNLASLPLTYAVLELGCRRVEHPGVHTPEEVFAPTRFLRAMAERGVRAARLVRL